MASFVDSMLSLHFRTDLRKTRALCYSLSLPSPLTRGRKELADAASQNNGRAG